jgi:uncharacterized zinc-type alcohol dehydrogenase-like protein
MSASTIFGYASMAVGEQLKPFYYDPPEVGVSDVRVLITHCGVCHSDIQAVDDYYGITNYPFVPGHEIVGYVSQAGSASKGKNSYAFRLSNQQPGYLTGVSRHPWS